eukprot:scaffold91881_cov33-Phaeocystis_antarctica.AAC.1
MRVAWVRACMWRGYTESVLGGESVHTCSRPSSSSASVASLARLYSFSVTWCPAMRRCSTSRCRATEGPASCISSSSSSAVVGHAKV